MTTEEKQTIRDMVLRANEYNLVVEIVTTLVDEIRNGLSVVEACDCALDEWDL